MTATRTSGRGTDARDDNLPGDPATHSLQAVTDRLSPSVFVGVLSTDGVMLHANQSALDAIGVPLEAVVGTHFTETPWWKGSPHVPRLRDAIDRAARGVPSNFEAPIHDKDGNERMLDVQLMPVFDEGGRVSYLVPSAQDITARCRAEQALRKTQLAVDNAAIAMLQSDASGVVRYANEYAARLLGYSREQLIGMPVHAIDTAITEDNWPQAWADLRARRTLVMESENIHADGHLIPVRVSVAYFEYAGEEFSFVSIENLTRRKTAERRARYLAQHDRLTRLPNRAQLCDRLKNMLRFADRAGSNVAMLLVGLDRFKDVNELLGHARGDALLRRAADRLAGCIGGNDSVARVGSDEFAVLLPYTLDAGSPEIAAQRIRDVFAAPFELDGQELFVTCSIGVAQYPRDGASADEVMKNASSALNRAKRFGRNEIFAYQPERGSRDPERLVLESELRHALARNELRVHYQPRMHMQDGRVSGVEALLRWEHPLKGMISPARFISIAEETGLILPIGAWVLREACRQAREWRARGLAVERIGVNISARQFRQPDLDAAIAAVVHEAGIEPAMLEIELTESMLMEDIEAAVETLRRLKATGVKIALDDFGTGYSSLSYLKCLPIDTLKIDRSFVHEINSDPASTAIADAIIVMAHRLKLDVIAEGVENDGQLDALRERGCDQVQGYLFSKPLSGDELTAMLMNAQRKD